ncbi:Ff.00g041610.m01.CDS01 [Fusarium sp. VM40]|nr:Ff.00g041610.m01.CDS01 [Fusarium sp. VM40]
MKLVIGGSTGYLGAEVVHQALNHPLITSVVALARRETHIPKGVDPQIAQSKFKSLTCSDFKDYPQDVRAEISDADACIWVIAITPARSKTYSWQEVNKICFDYAVSAADTFAKFPRDGKDTPFRFLYVSGFNATQDPSKKPWFLGDYCVMRGRVEKSVLECAHMSNGRMQACVARPGLIDPANSGMIRQAFQGIGNALIGFPRISIVDMAAALLDSTVHGFNKEILSNEDLTMAGQKALKALNEAE